MEDLKSKAMEGFEELKTRFEPWWNQALLYINQIPEEQLYVALGVLLFTIIFLILSMLCYSILPEFYV